MAERPVAARLRVVVISQMFAPEMGAATVRLRSFARTLAAAGHEVTVATGMPNYPQGRVHDGYRGRLLMRESMDGFTVTRTAYPTAPRNRSKVRQLISYLSFVPAALLSALRAGPVDVVVVSSPPLFPVVAAWAVSRIRRAPLVVDLRDLWPDEFVACGAASAGAAPVRALSALERWAYSRAARITCTTASFARAVSERGGEPERITIVPNGADVERFRPFPRDNPAAAALGLGDRFVVGYVGALGIKHDLDVLIEAARRLREQRDMAILLVGAGAREQDLRRRVREQGLENVVFAGARPPDEVPALIGAMDVCFSSLIPDPYLESILPVKLFEYMACEKPVIAAVRGEGARLVQAAGAGLVVPPGSPEAVADAVIELRHDARRRERMGREGRRFVVENYGRAAAAQAFAGVLAGAVRGGAAG